MTAIAENSTVIPPSAPPAIPAPAPAAEPPYSLPRIFLGLLLTVAACDYVFLNGHTIGGLALTVFVPVWAGAILFNRSGWTRRRSTLAIGALLAGACLAAAIESGYLNVLVLLILVVALAGDSFFETGAAVWARWFNQVVALVFAPGRVFWLAGRLLESGVDGRKRGAGIFGALFIAAPAVVLGLVFGSLLGSGNAVFGHWSDYFFTCLENEIGALFDLDRIAVWIMVAFVTLPLLRPGRISDWWWSWMPRVPRWPELGPVQATALSGALVLVVLNLLFGAANVADAIFLWGGLNLPSGVTYSEYVHNGVDTLTATVLLSAVVLTGIFQQQLKVASRRELKALGLIWVAQNLFVLVSVVLRLMRYIEAYDMSVKRLGVIVFLLLVAAGFGLLAIKIVREKSLPWLVGRCAVAVFGTLYITMFLNLSGWCADYNVAQWEKNRTRSLDGIYLRELGPAAWPALARAHALVSSIDVINSDEHNGWANSEDVGTAQFDTTHWREFSLRAYWNRGALE
jgi:hypothetical protein